MMVYCDNCSMSIIKLNKSKKVLYEYKKGLSLFKPLDGKISYIILIKYE